MCNVANVCNTHKHACQAKHQGSKQNPIKTEMEKKKEFIVV